jgi:hypothetical protein
MKWPCGKYNGKRIVGIRVSLEIDLSQWWFSASGNFGEPYLIVGPFTFRFYLVYR